MAHFNLSYKIVCKNCGSGKLIEIGNTRCCANGAISRNFKCEKCGKITNTYLQVCLLVNFPAVKKIDKGEK